MPYDHDYVCMMKQPVLFRAPVCFISSGLIFYRQRNCTLQYYLCVSCYRTLRRARFITLARVKSKTIART